MPHLSFYVYGVMCHSAAVALGLSERPKLNALFKFTASRADVVLSETKESKISRNP